MNDRNTCKRNDCRHNIVYHNGMGRCVVKGCFCHTFTLQEKKA